MESITDNKYYIYHIPGKKIGVTRDLNNRVTLVQGYKPNEYEVLDFSDDIDYISKKEIELQKSYGYRVDRSLYKNLFKSDMKVNVTEQTTTFPYPKSSLKENLIEFIGMEWETSLGNFELTEETLKWISTNSKKSMYNEDRSFIYNKAFYEAFMVEPTYKEENIFGLIRDWADERGIYDKGDVKTQLIKLYEESGELSQGILKDSKPDIVDAIGDCVVVLTNLAHLAGVDIESCIRSAYDEISSRTGEMKNGTFVKDQL
jgi:NTP pyrophosphatase (non-canonical NTP hydrolase)